MPWIRSLLILYHHDIFLGPRIFLLNNQENLTVGIEVLRLHLTFSTLKPLEAMLVIPNERSC